MKPRVLVQHTVQRPVTLNVYLDEWDGKPMNSLGWMIGSAEEKHFYSEIDGEQRDGPFAAYDADVAFEGRYVLVSGNNAPSGGSHNVEVKIPYHLITKLEIQGPYNKQPVFQEHIRELYALVSSRKRQGPIFTG